MQDRGTLQTHQISEQGSFTSTDAGDEYAIRARAVRAQARAAAIAAGQPVDDAALTGNLTEDEAASQRFADVPGQQGPVGHLGRGGNQSFHTAVGSPPSGYLDQDTVYDEGDTDQRNCAVM